MSVPQVHLIAIAAISVYGAARGAEMLSIMLACGCQPAGLRLHRRPHRGGRHAVLGSTLQCAPLVFYLPFNGLTSLYLVSALFGLSQAASCRATPSSCGIFPAREAGARSACVDDLVSSAWRPAAGSRARSST